VDYYEDPAPEMRPPQPAVEPKRLNRAAFVYIGAVMACLLAILAYRQYSGRLVVVPDPEVPETAIAATPPEREAARSRPQETVEPVQQRAAQLPPPAVRQPAAPVEAGGWAVVAAIYRDFESAERRAQAIQQRWGQFHATVFPAKGQGRKYMVVLGSGLSKEDADRLRRQATSAGLPRDTYVTKLTTGAPLPSD
jgi:hypothetical protein